MKHIIPLSVCALLTLSFPSLSQCRKDSGKPQSSETLVFTSGGVLQGPLSTVFIHEPSGVKQDLVIKVKDATLNDETSLHKKLKSSITYKGAAACLEPDFRTAVSNANSRRANYISDIVQHKKTTYQINNKGDQTLQDKEHLISLDAFTTSGKQSFRLVKKNADLTFFKELFKGKPEYVRWDEYKPLIRELYPVYAKYAAQIKRLSLEIEDQDTKCCVNDVPDTKRKLKDEKERLEFERCLYLDSILIPQNKLCKIAYSVAGKNKEWMNYWLWYTAGKPLLNPFGMVSPAEENKRIEQELASAEAVLRLYESLSAECCHSTKVKDMLEALKPDIIMLTRDLVQLRQLKEEAPARQKKYDDWLKTTARTETVINEVVLYTSDGSQINWMTHFDAQGKYAAMQPDGRLPDLVYEKDALRGLVHNLPANRQVSAKEVVKEAKLRTEIDVQTDEFTNVFSQALTHSNAITSLLDRIRGFLNTIGAVTEKAGQSRGEPEKSFSGGMKTESRLEDSRMQTILAVLREQLFEFPDRGKSSIERTSEEVDKILKSFKSIQASYTKNKRKIEDELTDNKPLNKDEFYEAVMILKKQLEEEKETDTKIKNLRMGVVHTPGSCYDNFTQSDELIEWLMEQSDPPIDDLQSAYNDFDRKKASQEPQLRSEDVLINESRKAEKTNDISYEIFEAGKDQPVATGKYKTYHTVRFWPTISINYVTGSRAVSVFDNSTGKFETNTDVDNFEAMVGVKYYWAPSNITRTPGRTKFISQTVGNNYNKKRGNSCLGKLFVTGGLGISHKFLRNYFLGIGMDIVPGFSVQGGHTLFFRKAYDINNGQISREYDVPATRVFFGLSIDPNVVTKLLSIF